MLLRLKGFREFHIKKGAILGLPGHVTSPFILRWVRVFPLCFLSRFFSLLLKAFHLKVYFVAHIKEVGIFENRIINLVDYLIDWDGVSDSIDLQLRVVWGIVRYIINKGRFPQRHQYS